VTEGFPPATFGPIGRADLLRYAQASGDMNPLHLDPEAARRAGFPDVIAHGMYSAGLVAAELVRRHGDGALLHYAVRFRSPVHLGDTLTLACNAWTARAGAVEFDLVLTRQSGEVAMTATARLRMPASEDLS
jgi:3-hydroxybutyryl-CoA dehydratase